MKHFKKLYFFVKSYLSEIKDFFSLSHALPVRMHTKNQKNPNKPQQTNQQQQQQKKKHPEKNFWQGT